MPKMGEQMSPELERAFRRVRRLERDRDAAILAAVDAGVSLAAIGRALGISRSAVHQRLARLRAEESAR